MGDLRKENAYWMARMADAIGEKRLLDVRMPGNIMLSGPLAGY